MEDKKKAVRDVQLAAEKKAAAEKEIRELEALAKWNNLSLLLKCTIGSSCVILLNKYCIWKESVMVIFVYGCRMVNNIVFVT